MSKNVSSEVCPRLVLKDCVFNPKSDLQEVDQFGFINLNDSLANGIVPGGIMVDDDDFNGVINPGTLISRSMDVFDGLRKAEYVKSQLSKLSAEDREKVENQIKSASEKQGVTPTEQP